MTPISVLFLTPWFPNVPGDREGNFIVDSARALTRAGAIVDVLVTRSVGAGLVTRNRYRARSKSMRASAFPEFRSVAVVRHLAVPRYWAPRVTAWAHDLRVAPALRRIVKERAVDLIHAHTEGEAHTAAEVGRILRLPVVVTIHGVNTAARHFGPHFNGRRIANGLAAADRVILVGEPLRAELREIVGTSDRLRVLPNGVDPPPVEPRQRFVSPDAPINFITVTNLHEGKGVDIAIRALAAASDAGLARWSLTIVGDGHAREDLVALAASEGVSDRVRFLGAKPHAEVFALLREADVFVLPSYREAFGVAYLEAMASGLLTIGVKGQGPSAFICDGTTGLLVEPRSVDDLAARLLDIMRMPDRMRAIAAAGAASVASSFTWDAHAIRLAEIYREVLGQ